MKKSLKKSLKKSKKIIILSVVLLAFFCVSAFKSAHFAAVPTVSAESENSFVSVAALSLYDTGICGYYETNEEIDLSEELSYDGLGVPITIINDYSTISFSRIAKDGEIDIVIFNDTFITIHSDIYDKFAIDNIINFSDFENLYTYTYDEGVFFLEKDKTYNFFDILQQFYNFEVITYQGQPCLSLGDTFKIWYDDQNVAMPDGCGAVIIEDYIISPENNTILNVGGAFCIVTNEALYAIFAFNKDINYFEIINNDFSQSSGAAIFSGGIYDGENEYNTMFVFNDELLWTDIVPSDGNGTELPTGTKITGNYNAIKYFDSGDIYLCYEDENIDNEPVWVKTNDTTNVLNNPMFINFSLVVNELIIETPEEEENPVVQGLTIVAIAVGSVILGPLSLIFAAATMFVTGLNATQAGLSFFDGVKIGFAKIYAAVYNVVEKIYSTTVEIAKKVIDTGKKIIEKGIEIIEKVIDVVSNAINPQKPFLWIIIAVIIIGIIVFILLKTKKRS